MSTLVNATFVLRQETSRMLTDLLIDFELISGSPLSLAAEVYRADDAGSCRAAIFFPPRTALNAEVAD